MKKLSKLQKAFLGVVLFFVALILGGWWFENWRGEKQWEAAKKRAEEKGVLLEKRAWIREIPAEEDLLKDPLFYEEIVSKGGEDLLKSWKDLSVGDNISNESMDPATGEFVRYEEWFDGEVGEEEALLKLAEAAKDYSKRMDELGKVVLSKPEHLVFQNGDASSTLFGDTEGILSIQSLAGCCQSAVLVALRMGDPETAMKRIRLLDRMAQISRGPFLIRSLVSDALKSVQRRLIWDGLRLRAWRAEDLAELFQQVQAHNYRADSVRALRFEMAFALDALDEIREMMRKGEELPDFMMEGQSEILSYGGISGWDHQRRAFFVESYLDIIEGLEEDDWSRFDEVDARIGEIGASSPVSGVASSFLFVSSSIRERYQKAETFRRIALLGIALEQHFQEHGTYPADLGQLKSPFPIQDLTDPAGRDIAYQLGKDGRPEIWSEFDQSLSEKERKDLRWQFWYDEPVKKSKPRKKRRNRRVRRKAPSE